MLSTQIGKTIKQIRISKQLKQSAVAAAVGMSVTAYSDIERGKTNNITLTRLEQIANVLEVQVVEIISSISRSNSNHAN
ncbi:helix-turn-helix domain-containing protein [Parafilimonas terrae]|uniref:Helix-turn-helix n=1 Tax=Parafilimonas terrae TaxID=1465490 RepID=A0A1I5XGN2_9BACT|nr:helix-turn-helix transcriptional regulator [Parafilimonas terrae]SFQ31121.1 Helix-turn-helix [Parafilimonas terrae]